MRILYIDIDTLRFDHLGCYGYNRNTSPNIDIIANEGTKFNECYCSDAPCLPSRASFFTGRFGIHTGIVGHGGTTADLRLTGKEREFIDFHANQMFVPLLRRLGYYTVSVSPFAERHSSFWFYSGFREMFNPGRRGNEIADNVFGYVEKWLNDNYRRDRWFLHVNFWDPHTNYRTPAEFGNPFENDPPPSWLTEEILQDHRKSYGPHSSREPWGWDVPDIPEEFLKKIRPPVDIRNLGDFKKWIDGYDTGIRYADYFVGKIVSILKKLKIYDDTFIMISSDHGEDQAELNIYGDHLTADHIVNHVPMIIKWPGKKWNKEYNNFIYATDVAATILEGLGEKIPSTWDGRSFYKEIEKNENFGREFLVIGQCAWAIQRAVRFDNWTLIRTYHTGLKKFPELMLFDYENDFHMIKNISNEKPEIVGQGLRLLDKWHADMMKTSTSDIDPMWTVIQEGGPSHTRHFLKRYLIRLMKSGREDMARDILERNEIYLETVTMEELKKNIEKESSLSLDSPLGQIVSDLKGRTIIEKHLGSNFLKNPRVTFAMGTSLTELSRWVPRFYTPRIMKAIQEDLSKIK